MTSGGFDGLLCWCVSGKYPGLHFDDLDLPTYKGELIFNDYAWKETMELWCGFAPELGDAAEFEGNAEVASMPCYPEQGSIRCIDGKIVVKFADEQ